MSKAHYSLTLNSVKESSIPSTKEIDVTIDCCSSPHSKEVVTTLCKRSQVLNLAKQKRTLPSWATVLTFSIGFLVSCWCTSARLSTQEAITDAVEAVTEAAKAVKHMMMALASFSS